jgi:hypothetical protein
MLPQATFYKTLPGQNINTSTRIFTSLHPTDLSPCNLLAFQILKITLKGPLTENIQSNMTAVPNGL